MKVKSNFNHNFLLISHYATYAMPDLINEYLIGNHARFVKKIDFPLPELPFLKTIKIEESVHGKIKKKYNILTLRKNIPLAYLIHFFQALWIVAVDDKTYDVAIAENSLLVLACFVLRIMGKIKKIVFYSHGIAGNRFKGSLINNIYTALDTFAATHSELNWLLSKKMIPVRVKQGVKRENIFWVPTALQIAKMKRRSATTKKSIIFLGTLNEMNGVLLLPEILKEVLKKLPLYSMDIIGDGPLRKELVKKIEKLKLQERIHILGVKGFDDYRKTLTEYAVALAPYKPSRNNLLNSTDPMKLRLYMAAGLPYVTTSGFPFSKETVENKLGYTVEYSSRKFANAAINLLNSEEENLIMRKNNLAYSKQFDQDIIFLTPLRKLLL